MGHNRVRPKYVQAERAVISSGIPVALLAGNVNKAAQSVVHPYLFSTTVIFTVI